jgi:hypothetical protein
MKLLAVCAAFEAITGAILILLPSFVANLLLCTSLTASGQAVGRVAGFALLSLGTACWPRSGSSKREGAQGLLVYNALVASFLVYLGSETAMRGPLLWPAAVVHVMVSILLVWALTVGDARH